MLRPVPWLDEVAVLPIRKALRPFRVLRLRSLAPTAGASAVFSGGGVPINVDRRIASSFNAEALSAADILSSLILCLVAACDSNAPWSCCSDPVP